MTPRDRILTTLAHECPDRIPTAVWSRPEVDRALAAYLKVEPGRVWAELGVEGWGGVGLGYTFPGWDERADGRLEGDMPYAGRRMIFHDDGTFEDCWGVRRRVGRDRKYVEWVSGPLQDIDDPAAIDFPGVDRISDPGNLPEKVAEQKARGLFVAGGLSMPFKTAWELRGLEQVLMDYAANRPFLEAFYDRMFESLLEMARRYAAAGVDMISITGDISMQDRLLMSPAAWRAVDKPRLAHLVAESRRVKPDVQWFIHSDGNYESIIPDLIEIGFTVLNPIQPECMDPVALKHAYGERVTLHGTGSIQRTLPFGSVDDCRNEVLHRIRHCGRNGGLVLMPSNVLQPDTPPENIVAWFETARDTDPSRL